MNIIRRLSMIVVFSIFIIFILSLNEVYAISVSVIAPSSSASREAAKFCRKLGLNEVLDPRYADAVLVVCRSSSRYPLNIMYDSYNELELDANLQTSSFGSSMHLYIFVFDNRLALIEYYHKSFPYDD